MSAKISAALLAGVLVALLPGGSALELRGATVSSAPLAFGVLMPPAPRPALGSRGTRLCSVARGTQFQPAVLARKRHGGADMGVRMSSGGGATPKEEDFPLIRLVTFLTR